ncbi:GDP-L-fucose synthase, partial [Escherichia coli]
GTPRKLMDVTRLKNLGWQYRYNLHEGLSLTYKWFIENINSFRG